MHEITLRKMGGFLNTPTPGGVPVRNTSPGVNVTNLTEEKEKNTVEAQIQGQERERVLHRKVIITVHLNLFRYKVTSQIYPSVYADLVKSAVGCHYYSMT